MIAALRARMMSSRGWTDLLSNRVSTKKGAKRNADDSLMFLDVVAWVVAAAADVVPCPLLPPLFVCGACAVVPVVGALVLALQL